MVSQAFRSNRVPVWVAKGAGPRGAIVAPGQPLLRRGTCAPNARRGRSALSMRMSGEERRERVQCAGDGTSSDGSSVLGFGTNAVLTAFVFMRSRARAEAYYDAAPDDDGPEAVP